MNPEEIWNTRYSKPKYAYGKAPNDFFAKELEKLTPASILFLAEGEGHIEFFKSNSFYKGLIKLSELKGFLISRGYWSNNRLRM